ncbi:MAG: hypothetical protein R3E68_23285 [Burkholderiaceae bacterium]
MIPPAMRLPALPRLLPLMLPLLLAGGCQSSIDLSDKSSPLAGMAVPTCAVQAADYRKLAEWRERKVDRDYAYLVEAMEARYAAVPPVGGKTVLALAQRYVSARTDLDPAGIERSVATHCR